MIPRRSVLLFFLVLLVGIGASIFRAAADSDPLAFAVVSAAPTEKTRVVAKVAMNETVGELVLLPSETILNNLAWRQLEICHALRLEGLPMAEGFHVSSVRAIDAAMLPMSLQSFAGDCLIRKALSIAPLVD